MRKNILCLLLAILFLFSAVPALAEGEDPEEAPEVPGERINFLLAGIDHRSDGHTTSGTMVHADTVMIVAADFTNNKVDLISLARDMLVRVPGHKGYYKLNAAFNVGGDMNDPDNGFLTLAATASEVMGGISIPYYFAVDLSSLIGLVDAIGGVDIDVDQDFKTRSGRKFKAGMQHMDGEGFLLYVRLRKSATSESNDVGRTNRQRNALLALYKTVKANGIITTLPSIISSFKDGIWTNISLPQMATLANFALDFDPDSVGMHSLPGKIKVNGGWAYHFIDQAARIEPIRSIYGMEVGVYGIDSMNYFDYLEDSGFNGRKVIAQAEKVFAALAEQIEGGTPMTDQQTQLYTDAYVAYGDAVQALDALDEFMMTYCDGVPREKRAEQKTLKETVSSTQRSCKKTLLALAKTLGMKDSDFKWVPWPTFYKDPDINEVLVDFN